jgi:hypothetical protein
MKLLDKQQQKSFTIPEEDKKDEDEDKNAYVDDDGPDWEWGRDEPRSGDYYHSDTSSPQEVEEHLGNFIPSGNYYSPNTEEEKKSDSSIITCTSTTSDLPSSTSIMDSPSTSSSEKKRKGVQLESSESEDWSGIHIFAIHPS